MSYLTTIKIRWFGLFVCLFVCFGCFCLGFCFVLFCFVPLFACIVLIFFVCFLFVLFPF